MGLRTMPELRLLPKLDDDQMAAECRQDLDISRSDAAELGRAAVAAIRAGSVETASGQSVYWREAVRLATESSQAEVSCTGLEHKRKS